MVKAYEPLYTIKEVAAVLKMNVADVYKLCNTGKLPHLQLGRIKVKGTDLERFINEYPVERTNKE